MWVSCDAQSVENANNAGQLLTFIRPQQARNNRKRYSSIFSLWKQDYLTWAGQDVDDFPGFGLCLSTRSFHVLTSTGTLRSSNETPVRTPSVQVPVRSVGTNMRTPRAPYLSLKSKSGVSLRLFFFFRPRVKRPRVDYTQEKPHPITVHDEVKSRNEVGVDTCNALYTHTRESTAGSRSWLLLVLLPRRLLLLLVVLVLRNRASLVFLLPPSPERAGQAGHGGLHKKSKCDDANKTSTGDKFLTSHDVWASAIQYSRSARNRTRQHAHKTRQHSWNDTKNGEVSFCSQVAQPTEVNYVKGTAQCWNMTDHRRNERENLFCCRQN